MATWYTRLANFKVETIFQRAPPPSTARSIYVHQDLPPECFDKKGKVKKEHVFVSNQVLTSKYTVITFLPRNLLEQFRRVANVFFAAIAILQFFPKFATISPGLVILPLLFILLVTALKDGYEDFKRHQSDRRVNQALTHVLAGGDFQNPNPTVEKQRKLNWERVLPWQKIKRPANPAKVLAEAHGSPKQADDTIIVPAGSASPTPSPSHTDDNDNYSPDSGLAFWKPTIWEDVRVGDYVKIFDNDPIPADIVICATSEEENVAYVETKNLDGETNLKSRHAVDELSFLRTSAACGDRANDLRVDAEAPSVNMYKLTAAVETSKGKYPIDLQTTLLRGTVLRNTKWVIGVVMFTGTDSKIVLNSGGTPSKQSKVERQMNPQVFINLALLGVITVVCAVVEAIIEHTGVKKEEYWFFHDNTSGDNPSINGLVTMGNALITFQNVIPISLYVSIEVVRTCQAAFIYFDYDIWYAKTDTATLARSWNLSDDLGQIEYLFSDKTGTLTQNVMVFRQCSVGGKLYKGEQSSSASKLVDAHVEEPVSANVEPKNNEKTPVVDKVDLADGVARHFVDETLTSDILEAGHSTSDHARLLNGFFTCLALCHSALASVDPKTAAITYKAQSPDESALVQAAADVGFIFLGRERELLRLRTPFSASATEDHEIEEWELLEVLDFTSARKRMSVVVRRLDEDRRIFLFTKGADNVIFERLASGRDDLRQSTEEHLDEFASDGLRTLCLAYKIIPVEEYEAWAERYHEATVSLEDRETKIEVVSDQLERDLRLLGATAIEDRLQDGVPEAIADLKRAGIKVWVATGDKLETAISIGYSTNLIARDSNLIVIRNGSEYGNPASTYDQMRTAVERFFPSDGIFDREGVTPDAPADISRLSTPRQSASGLSDIAGSGNGERPGGFVLVIDGGSLSHAFNESEPFSKVLLLQLAMRCEAVVCCRVSPLQKALVVKMVKEGLGAMTLAIGDGANDVSMIQAADVGVGITGEEGLQAVNSSDYAIAQFRFLTRLLFVHGHWSYYRNGNMIVNFFYKNIVCIGVLFWFQIYCDWSTTYVMDYTYLLFWNVFFTIAPVIAIGLFDRQMDSDILVALPELYRYGREARWFGTKNFIWFMLDAVYQSAVIFFFILYAYVSTSGRHDGYDVGMYEFSTVMVIAAVMVANMYNGLTTRAWTWWVLFAVSIGIIIVWAFLCIYSLISPGWFWTYSYGNAYFVLRAPYFWLSVPLVFCLSLAPRYLTTAVQSIFYPDDLDILRAARKQNPNLDIMKDPMLGGYRTNMYQLRYTPTNREDDDDTRSLPPPRQSRPSLDLRGSRTDMSTGIISSGHRGFDFSTEERGYAMTRMQTNLSERRLEQLQGRQRGEPPETRRRGSIIPSLLKSKSKRKPAA